PPHSQAPDWSGRLAGAGSYRSRSSRRSMGRSLIAGLLAVVRQAADGDLHGTEDSLAGREGRGRRAVGQLLPVRSVFAERHVALGVRAGHVVTLPHGVGGIND